MNIKYNRSLTSQGSYIIIASVIITLPCMLAACQDNSKQTSEQGVLQLIASASTSESVVTGESESLKLLNTPLADVDAEEWLNRAEACLKDTTDNDVAQQLTELITKLEEMIEIQYWEEQALSAIKGVDFSRSRRHGVIRECLKHVQDSDLREKLEKELSAINNEIQAEKKELCEASAPERAEAKKLEDTLSAVEMKFTGFCEGRYIHEIEEILARRNFAVIEEGMTTNQHGLNPYITWCGVCTEGGYKFFVTVRLEYGRGGYHFHRVEVEYCGF